MLHKVLLPILGVAGLLALAAVGVVFYIVTQSESPTIGGLGSRPEYYGPTTLEERIAEADVIVRARLVSVSAVSERRTGRSGHYAALDYRFQVLEYLKGSGGGELVGVVYNTGREYATAAGARARSNAYKDKRDTRWDDREAIVFLDDDHPGLPSSRQADRYRLGALSFYEDYYTIASPWGKRWLPAEAAGGAAAGAGGSGAQRFLLDAPRPAASGASAQAAAAPTITLADMKAKIAEYERKVAAGGGSQAYRDCLYEKYRWERRVRYDKEWGGSFGEGRDYYYIRHNSSIGSGLSTGTRVHTDTYTDVAGIAPADAGDFPIMGRDAGRFSTRWPAVAETVRPLPAGEYKFYYSYRPPRYIICDGQPEEEKKREEVFVTVTAPAGALHEAFFDPIYATSSGEYKADASNGTLKPAGYRKAGDTATTTIHSIAWKAQQATLTTSPGALPANHHVDFIELDGTVSLRLDVDTATTTTSGGKHTLSWRICRQPWHAGDKLMLRIAQSGANLSGATSDAACTTPNPKPTPTPVATSTPTPPQVAGFQVTSSGRGSISIGWQSRDGIAKYQLEYRFRGQDWRLVSNAITSTSHTESGLTCGPREHFFRIRAYGDGATYAAQWGEWRNLAQVMPC